MKIGYRAGYRDGLRQGRKKGFEAGKEKGQEEGYRLALEDLKDHEPRMVATGVRLAQENILRHLMSRPEKVSMSDWALQVMQELEDALALP